MSKDNITVTVEGKKITLDEQQVLNLYLQSQASIDTDAARAAEVEDFDLVGPGTNASDGDKTKTIYYRVKGIDGERFELKVTEEEYENYQYMSKEDRVKFIKRHYRKGYFKDLRKKWESDQEKNNEWYKSLVASFDEQSMHKVTISGKDGDKEVVFTPGNQHYLRKLLENGNYKEANAFMKRMYETGGPYFKIERRRSNGGIMYYSYCFSDDARPVTPDYKTGKCYNGDDGTALYHYTKEKSGLDLEINWYQGADGKYYPVSSDPNIRIIDENGNELESDWHNINENSFMQPGQEIAVNSKARRGMNDYMNQPLF